MIDALRIVHRDYQTYSGVSTAVRTASTENITAPTAEILPVLSLPAVLAAELLQVRTYLVLLYFTAVLTRHGKERTIRNTSTTAVGMLHTSTICSYEYFECSLYVRSSRLRHSSSTMRHQQKPITSTHEYCIRRGLYYTVVLTMLNTIRGRAV